MDDIKYFLYILLIINLFTVVFTKKYSVEDDYLYILHNIQEKTKLYNCTNIINSYKNCILDYNNDVIPDYNSLCDNFSNKICNLIIENIDNNVLQCEKEYRNQLVKVMTNIYHVSKLFCYRGDNSEFCPISRIFQKAKTVKENVNSEDFYSYSILHTYCLDESCSQYIDESYIGIYALYNIGIINDENIMSSLKYINDFIASRDCYKIRQAYGNVKSEENESFSNKNYRISVKLIIIILLFLFSSFYIF
ncbi:hypothetical protein H8356DRAFT_1673405 [Neocallimastix lanati (nom. inval.)]|uniref:Uncharacterized protein n=1 Tax=Neocallimastix californiae TaxID=1754190 RepID=A0A1Y2AZ49_9FUNG|nr:hypothetical protein H8356DRAFT_1673405 [Neocallimastix sp. JGI-2020a]ORY27848.1 hypothetical protein LY90DRAFT_513329 [Neocallimastix californiae]|eukprot:ORY27848.1 hypothetical protein LY90DRAFT_513329 [Neocallimastix californiae]